MLSAETMAALKQHGITSTYGVAHLTDGEVEQLQLGDVQTARLIRAARMTAFDLAIPW